MDGLVSGGMDHEAFGSVEIFDIEVEAAIAIGDGAGELEDGARGGEPGDDAFAGCAGMWFGEVAGDELSADLGGEGGALAVGMEDVGPAEAGPAVGEHEEVEAGSIGLVFG